MIYRLPTEAEWEYACRAGSKTAFCFGDDEGGLAEHAWYLANSEYKTHPVGQKKPNAWGLYDMHGNVEEWCADLYDNGYYAKSRAGDRKGPGWADRRVLRGGCWRLDPVFARSAFRSGFDRSGGIDLDGFRVVVSAQE
jgi:formylglycine-generating enzyme required for sulfatase activity